MKTIKIKSYEDISDNFTGIAEYPDGSKVHWVDGNLHRLDGPAYERANGAKIYYVDGKLHRIDGPAIEFNGTKKYWIEDKQVTKEAQELLYSLMKLKGLL